MEMQDHICGVVSVCEKYLTCRLVAMCGFICGFKKKKEQSLTGAFLSVSVSQLWQPLLHSVAVLLSTPQLCLLLITPQLQTGTLETFDRQHILWRCSDSNRKYSSVSHTCKHLTLVRSYFSMSWSLATCSPISLSCSYKIKFNFSPQNWKHQCVSCTSFLPTLRESSSSLCSFWSVHKGALWESSFTELFLGSLSR